MNLHPCPLCGKSKGYTLNWSGYVYQVYCNACGKVAANSYMEARADAAWNSAAAHAQGLRERIAELEASDALQPCGHPKSLVLHSAESGEPLYCETCDDKSGRRDAELRESELAAANAALRERIAELEAQRVPLTKAEITACCNESDTYKTGVWMRVHETTLERLVRAIERAHGIEEVKR